MSDPPSPTSTAHRAVVVAADEQVELPVDLDRWRRLATAVLDDEGADGELALTFVDRHEIAALNVEHLGHDGPTDVLSFPLDVDGPPAGARTVVPMLLGDVVVCPGVAADQAGDHAGTLDDELALLVVHGVLHVLGHDHADAAERAVMRERELTHLRRHHWHGPPPEAFHQDHST